MIFYFGYPPKFFYHRKYKYSLNVEKEVYQAILRTNNDFWKLQEKLKEVNQIFVSVEEGILKSAPWILPESFSLFWALWFQASSR